jgi:OOP family OmpA-OmpF porin
MVGVALLAIAVGGCAAMRKQPAAEAPASGTKLAEITGPGFEPGKARLTDAGRMQVDEVARVLQEHPELRVSVDGHTDSAGSETYNQSLSQRRARAVANRLTEQGIAGDRLSVRGFGESRPVADNKSAEGRSRNRRVEIVVE